MAAELHFLVVPLIAQGHIIPMVEVARLLAARGARATVVTTPVNAARNGAAVEAARRDGLAVDLAEVAFPGPEFGVPEGLENMDQLADADPGMYLPLQRAIWAMAAPLERLVRALPRRPDCLVADYCNPWTAPVCDRLGIARVVMHCPSAYFLLATHNLSKHGVYGLAAGDGSRSRCRTSRCAPSSTRPRSAASSSGLAWRRRSATRSRPSAPPMASSSTRSATSRAPSSTATRRRSAGGRGPSGRPSAASPTLRRSRSSSSPAASRRRGGRSSGPSRRPRPPPLPPPP
uniref:Glycosyltransferase n=1 Tax=Oryza glaberrima TaxID=4538 RepID=I1NKR1_ORYGL